MKPNIFLIVIDSFGSDKCFGHKKSSVTPNLDNLIKNGVIFPKAVSPATSTVPNLASLFTSLYPFEAIVQHGITFKLSPNIKTCIATLNENGYETHSLFPKITHTDILREFRNDLKLYDIDSSLNDGVGEQILQKLDELKKHKPWFYYVHIFDAHEFLRHKIPKELDNVKFGKNKYERMISTIDVWIGHFLKKIDLNDTLFLLTADHPSLYGDYSDDELLKSEIGKNKTKYNNKFFKIGGKILRNSEFLKPVYQKLAQANPNEGYKKRLEMEEKMEKNLLNVDLSSYKKRFLLNSIAFKSNVYDEACIIPLILTGYGIKENMVIEQPVSNIDIFPTVLELANLKIPEKRRGRSLLSLISNNKLEEVPAFVESCTNSIKSLQDNVVGLRTNSYKYFRDRINSKKNIHLYDLKDDPLEEKNIANENREVINKMESILHQIAGNKDFSFTMSDELIDPDDEDEVEEELRKLGYL